MQASRTKVTVAAPSIPTLIAFRYQTAASRENSRKTPVSRLILITARADKV